MAENFYLMLGLQQTNDDGQIDRAYRKSKSAHKDDTERLKLIEAAFHTLGNPNRRKAYDATLRNTPPPTAGTQPEQPIVNAPQRDATNPPSVLQPTPVKPDTSSRNNLGEPRRLVREMTQLGGDSPPRRESGPQPKPVTSRNIEPESNRQSAPAKPDNTRAPQRSETHLGGDPMPRRESEPQPKPVTPRAVEQNDDRQNVTPNPGIGDRPVRTDTQLGSAGPSSLPTIQQSPDQSAKQEGHSPYYGPDAPQRVGQQKNGPRGHALTALGDNSPRPEPAVGESGALGTSGDEQQPELSSQQANSAQGGGTAGLQEPEITIVAPPQPPIQKEIESEVTVMRNGARIQISYKDYSDYVDLHSGDNIIGRLQKKYKEKDRKPDIPITDEGRLVSREHACIYEEKGEWFITDTSANGTMLDGRKLDKNLSTRLHNGAEIDIEGRKLIFLLHAGQS